MGTGNALLVAVFGIPAIVATLGTLAIYRGAVLVYAGGRQISATVLPDNYEGIARIDIAGVPLLVWLAAAHHRRHRTGGALHAHRAQSLCARQQSRERALRSASASAGSVAFVFLLSGFLSGLVGVLWGARFGTVDAVIAPELNLQSISAVVIGGVSIFGGSGTVYGAAIGAVIFAVLQNGVQLLGINQFWLQAVVGAAILVTVFFYSILARRAERHGARVETRRRAGASATPEAGNERAPRAPRALGGVPPPRARRDLRLRRRGLEVFPHRVEHLHRARRHRRRWRSSPCPMTLIIITGEIDISVGSMVGLCASSMAVCLEQGFRSKRRCSLGVLVGIARRRASTA